MVDHRIRPQRQLLIGARHIGRRHVEADDSTLRLAVQMLRTAAQKAIAGRNGVGAKDGDLLAQLLQQILQSESTPQGIAIRPNMANKGQLLLTL